METIKLTYEAGTPLVVPVHRIIAISGANGGSAITIEGLPHAYIVQETPGQVRTAMALSSEQRNGSDGMAELVETARRIHHALEALEVTIRRWTP